MNDLPAVVAGEALTLYRSLGGLQAQPDLRPGAWDLVFDSPLLVELDEELHFNRYRAATLAASWEQQLPWTASYRDHCADHEDDCLTAGSWGKRWTNDSAGRMFSGGPVGDLDGDGAPRWKQRALYDAIKDTMSGSAGGARLVRVAIYDLVGGVVVGAMLDGVAPIDVPGLRTLVEARAA